MRAILTYHSIDDSGSPISVHPETFRAHCEFFSSGRVEVLPLDALLVHNSNTDALSLTFDDGFSNFATEAAPLLERHALPSTLFVVTDHAGGHNDWGGEPARGVPRLPLLGWAELAGLQSRGVLIGAHTRRHPPLTRVRGADLADEVQGALARIEAALGRRPDAFAYPYGAVDAESASQVREACAMACTTQLRPLGTSEDRALLPRIDMYYLRDPGQLEAWGTARFRSRLWLRGQGRRLRRLTLGGRRMERAA